VSHSDALHHWWWGRNQLCCPGTVMYCMSQRKLIVSQCPFTELHRGLR